MEKHPTANESAAEWSAFDVRYPNSSTPAADLHTELLILPDGQILVHNLTQPFAELLAVLNPSCESIVSRTTDPASLSHELPD